MVACARIISYRGMHHTGVCPTCECSRDFHADFYCLLVNCAPTLKWNKRRIDGKLPTRNTFINNTFYDSNNEIRRRSSGRHQRKTYIFIIEVMIIPFLVCFQFNKIQKIAIYFVLSSDNHFEDDTVFVAKRIRLSVSNESHEITK